MKKMSMFAMQVMAVAGITITEVSAQASDVFFGQYNAVKGEAAGPGYAMTQGYSYNIADAFRNSVSYQNPKAGIAYDFNNTQLVGASVAAGIAVAQNGRATIDVVSAQNILNLNNR